VDKLAYQPSHMVIAAGSSMPELTLREVGAMLTRRRGIIYVTVLVFFLLGILALTFSTRRYRSMGEIELQKDATSSLGIQTDSPDTPSDALEVNMLIQTQAAILQSDSLALRVIEDLTWSKRRIIGRSGARSIGFSVIFRRKAHPIPRVRRSKTRPIGGCGS